MKCYRDDFKRSPASELHVSFPEQLYQSPGLISDSGDAPIALPKISLGTGWAQFGHKNPGAGTEISVNH
ncbi:acyl-CoA dehydrogenase [Thiohalobacter thiocyanaticus]|uniref:Acyl-CoA dehydrogenase n=1 Tax=Thiohalobacter thiocyanaticus TaxID=585455 RepID=A0A1Z4VLS8_9GAMM|nr:acyl-CoA dehydrogenase [Thiohalobacter thiocyanaticus]